MASEGSRHAHGTQIYMQAAHLLHKKEVECVDLKSVGVGTVHSCHAHV